MATYNGHKNWNHWNVSLWIANDGGLYALACSFVKTSRSRKEAARDMLAALRGMGTLATPDGARYTVTTIRAALRGFDR
jgi:protocatechuate 3,4-dioxygenase beta subunit